ncbi:trigger factor [Quadrisphaera sp. DSM 44207]|nr:trigger factor [Quadrisphaera sp. DSM 44207]SDQ05681.1 trigger factor [Quadrisphaera sp. DSM 44207]
MKSDVETINPTRVKLTVEVPFAELKPSLDAAYRTIAGQVQVPGFRKGKVPPRIIDQRFGRGVVLQEAINDALPKLYQQAVQETAVRPLGQPQVDVTEIPAEADGGELRFTAEVDVRPTLQLPDYSSIAVSVDDVSVSDEDVDAQLQQLRQRFGTLVGVDRPVAAGDFVSLDLTATIGDEEIDTASGVSYEVGSGTMLPGMDEAITGAAAGEERTFTAPLAGGEHAGEDATVRVTVQSVKERELPEADDDFAQLASEFDTLEELRADLRAKAEQEKEFEQGVQARDKVLEALLEAVEVPVPESVVEEEVHRHLEAESRLEDDEHRAEVTEEARKALRTQLLLDTIAEEEQVSVNQAELVEYIVAQAPRYGMDANAFAQAMDQAGQVPALVAEVARRKALSVVLERARVTDASGAPVDLGAVIGDEEEDAAATAEGSADAAEAEGGAVDAPVDAPVDASVDAPVEAGVPAVEADVEAAAPAEEAPAPARRASRAKAAPAADDADAEARPAPAKRASRAKAAPAADAAAPDAEAGDAPAADAPAADAEATPAPAKRASRAKAAAADASAADASAADASAADAPAADADQVPAAPEA